MKDPVERDKLFAASLTVETALLMPIIFLTVFSCIFLTFQYHNAAAMTANAAETAITGKQQEFPNYVGAGKVTLVMDDKKKERTSSVSGLISSWLNPGGTMNCSQTYKKVNPVHMLRKIRAIHNS